MRNISINLIFMIIIGMFLFSCSNKNHVIYNPIKGRVISSIYKKPIKDAKVYVAKGSSNDFGFISTDKNGTFFIEGLKLPHKYLHNQRNLSFYYFIEKAGYKKKIINIKNLKKSENNEFETIDLGEIYLEPNN